MGAVAAARATWVRTLPGWTAADAGPAQGRRGSPETGTEAGQLGRVRLNRGGGHVWQLVEAGDWPGVSRNGAPANWQS